MRSFINQDFVDPNFAQLWLKGRDLFQAAKEQEGKTFRQLEGRRTLRFELDQKGYFLKYHAGIGWGEIFKNLLSFRLPILGATNEYEAIRLLEQHDIPTMKAMAFAKRGKNPAQQESFIVTEEIAHQFTLEDIASQQQLQPIEEPLKEFFIKRLAQIVGGMHFAGLNHRDCYLCHFLVRDTAQGKELSVIDLHRSQIRQRVPKRWLIKDLAGLYFSSLEAGLSVEDYQLFVDDYCNLMAAKYAYIKHPSFWKTVKKKGKALYLKEQAKIRS